MHLTNYRLLILVRDKIEDTVADNAIRRVVGQGIAEMRA
jgi:hypothetical protein